MTSRQIVDNSDQVIALKEEQDIDFSQDVYHVAALWLTDTEGKVLIAQRSLDNNNGAGQWGPAVAGTLEGDDTYESNIYKEAEEEIGLGNVTFQLGPKTFHDGERKYFCQWFSASIEPRDINSFKLQASEVSAVQWIGLDDLLIDIANKPEKYVPGMEQTVRQLI